MTLRISVLRGQDVARHLSALARLRGQVFREWPYLYDADDPGYEQRYLSVYAASPGSVFVLAFDEDEIVGAATGIPLADDDAAFHAPFVACGLPVEHVFYFGESVLLPAYRGRGIGHRFFDEREAHARRLGNFACTAFCAVDRREDDPRKPAGHRQNDTFWRKRGYARRPDMQCRLEWKEVGESQASCKTLTFWLRRLHPST